MKRIILSLIAIMTCGLASAQIQMPPASPTFEVKGTVGLAEVKVVYSRPSARGRKVAGELIPYNEVWRTGANASTKISFSEDVKLEGNPVPAGEYALYTIFTEEEATIILSKNLTWWGSLGYDSKDDLLRFKVPVKHPSSHYETFTISFSDFTMNSAYLNMKWEHTKAMCNWLMALNTGYVLVVFLSKYFDPKTMVPSFKGPVSKASGTGPLLRSVFLIISVVTLTLSGILYNFAANEWTANSLGTSKWFSSGGRIITLVILALQFAMLQKQMDESIVKTKKEAGASTGEQAEA